MNQNMNTTNFVVQFSMETYVSCELITAIQMALLFMTQGDPTLSIWYALNLPMGSLLNASRESAIINCHFDVFH